MSEGGYIYLSNRNIQYLKIERNLKKNMQGSQLPGCERPELESLIAFESVGQTTLSSPHLDN